MHNEREFILYRAQRTNVNISQLIDGSGIAATLKSHKAMYHKLYRSYCSSSRVKRARGKIDKDACAQNSPKKLR